MYRVRLASNTLVNPTVFDTVEKATEFAQTLRDENDKHWYLQHVRPIQFGDLILDTDLLSLMKENVAGLGLNESFVEDVFHGEDGRAMYEELLVATRATLNYWGKSRGVNLDGYVLLGEQRVDY